MTPKAVGLGLFLAFVFGASNAYLGMKAGQTVAATIPAAVIALALFRIPRFRGGVLEQNITRTAASVGEALVAGAIFTIPAFMLVEMGGQRLWADLRAHYWEAALVLLAIGVKGAPGVAAVLGVAAVVCCACCVSGSLIQDLKAGHLLGGTPWKMEVVEIIAVVTLAFFLMAPIVVLHEANLATGGIGGTELPAPQAGLMAQLARGIVGGQMAWGLLGIGAAFGVALIACGARAPMLVAVGMYLPFHTVSAIFVGGVLRWVSDRLAARAPAQTQQRVEERGTLLASGLIAGEAIVGILLAVLVVSGVPSLTRLLTGADALSFYPTWGGWLSLVGFAVLAWVLTFSSVSGRRSRPRPGSA